MFVMPIELYQQYYDLYRHLRDTFQLQTLYFNISEFAFESISRTRAASRRKTVLDTSHQSDVGR